MQSLAIDDLLVGARDRQRQMLAQSWEGQEDEEEREELFEDAMSDDDGRNGDGADPAAPHPRQQLVSVSFAATPASSPRYSGVDCELELKLSLLHLRCHRPTVAALMSLGSDMALAGSLLAAEAGAGAAVGEELPPPTIVEEGGDDAGGGGSDTKSPAPASAAPAASSSGAPQLSPMDARGARGSEQGAGDEHVVRRGGPERTLLRLRMELDELRLLLDYEGSPARRSSTTAEEGERSGSSSSLLVTSVSRFSAKLDVHPDAMQISSSLGDVVATYGSLSASTERQQEDKWSAHSNATLCELRPGSVGSLIDLTFRMHGVGEPAPVDKQTGLPRVPPGLAYYRCENVWDVFLSIVLHAL